MSTYQVQQCLFDYLRALEKVPVGGPRPDLDSSGYELTDDERAALLAGDVDTLYRMGTHPVIINGYCRAMGWKRAEYRTLFSRTVPRQGGRARWQRS